MFILKIVWMCPRTLFIYISMDKKSFVIRRYSVALCSGSCGVGWTLCDYEILTSPMVTHWVIPSKKTVYEVIPSNHLLWYREMSMCQLTWIHLSTIGAITILVYVSPRYYLHTSISIRECIRAYKCTHILNDNQIFYFGVMGHHSNAHNTR